MPSSSPRVAFFITCLGDQFFPAVGECVVAVLRRLGMETRFDIAHTYAVGELSKARPRDICTFQWYVCPIEVIRSAP